MKYKAGERRKALEYEKALVEFWKKNKTFEQSVEMRPAHDSYVFYDGPPFITGNPHHGTLLSSIVKDARLETGVIVKVPAFIKTDDVISVDTESYAYRERQK